MLSLPLNQKAIIETCCCDERLQLFGLRPGQEIELIGECVFGGTVIVKCKFGQFCVRRKDINITFK
jgi:Fe2+ transport system protein FeoA